MGKQSVERHLAAMHQTNRRAGREEAGAKALAQVFMFTALTVVGALYVWSRSPAARTTLMPNDHAASRPAAPDSFILLMLAVTLVLGAPQLARGLRRPLRAVVAMLIPTTLICSVAVSILGFDPANPVPFGSECLVALLAGASYVWLRRHPKRVAPRVAIAVLQIPATLLAAATAAMLLPAATHLPSRYRPAVVVGGILIAGLVATPLLVLYSLRRSLPWNRLPRQERAVVTGR